MGVHGLWQLIQPAGRPVSLESLQGKVLAIDVSIWLNQTVKGMRDQFGNPLPNAHLIGLFHRISKLLFYQIKPIFVFDGTAPLLKRQTLAARRQRKYDAGVKSSTTAKKILKSLMKHHAIGTVLGTNKAQTAELTIPSQSVIPRENDMFELPPLSRPTQQQSEDEVDNWEYRMEQQQLINSEFQDLEDVDVDSADFKALPAEIQHEILMELRETRRGKFTNEEELPENSSDFSNYQITKLMHRSRLTQKIEDVRKDLNSQSTAGVTLDLDDAYTASEVLSQKILSEDSSHYILLKGVSLSRPDDSSKSEPSSSQISDLSFEAPSIKPRTASKSDIHAESTDLVGGGDSEISKNSQMKSNHFIIETESETTKVVSPQSDQIMKATASTESEIDDRFTSETRKSEQVEVALSDEESDDNSVPIATECQAILQPKRSGIHQDVKILERETRSEVLSDKESDNNLVSTATDCQVVPQIIRTKSHDEETEAAMNPGIEDIVGRKEDESEDDFIEVVVDPAAAKSDDPLFPASVFMTTPSPSNEEEAVEMNVPDIAVQQQSQSEQDHLMAADTQPEENEFEGMSKEELEDLQALLQSESKMLHNQKGKEERQASTVTEHMYVDAQELLRLFGVPYLISPAEAEAQCAYLDLTDQTDGSVTDDSDIWLFGGKRVYRNFFSQNRFVEFYKATDIESQFLLDRPTMINLALMCGSDYTEGIQGIGPVTAMEVLGEFPGYGLSGLKQFKEWWDNRQKDVRARQESVIKSKLRKLHIKDGFPSQAVMDAYINATVDDSEEAFTWGTPDLDLLREYAGDKLGWSKTKVDEILLPVLQQRNQSQQQRNITSYFTPQLDVPSKLKSKRVKRMLSRMRTGDSEQSKNSPEKKTPKNVSKKTSKSRSKTTKKNIRTSGGWLSRSTGGAATTGMSAQGPELSEDSSEEDILPDNVTADLLSDPFLEPCAGQSELSDSAAPSGETLSTIMHCERLSNRQLNTQQKTAKNMADCSKNDIDDCSDDYAPTRKKTKVSSKSKRTTKSKTKEKK